MPGHGRFFREETSFKFLWIKRNAAVERKEIEYRCGGLFLPFLASFVPLPPWL
jgi:hypothetical protein